MFDTIYAWNQDSEEKKDFRVLFIMYSCIMDTPIFFN